MKSRMVRLHVLSIFIPYFTISEQLLKQKGGNKVPLYLRRSSCKRFTTPYKHKTTSDKRKIMNRIKCIAVFGILLLGFNTLEACNMKFKIIYSNACLSTIFSITPHFFDKGLIKSSLDSVMVGSNTECVEFMDVISSLKEVKMKEEEKHPAINVRAKIIVYLNDQFWDSFYWGMFYLYHNGKVYEINKEFRDKVNLMVKKVENQKCFDKSRT